MDEGLYNDLVYMIGELYVQRRMEQTKNVKLAERISELEAEKEGGDHDSN